MEIHKDTIALANYANWDFTTTETDHSSFFANAEALTPEALMLYCQTRLRSLDNDIKGFMDNQRYLNEKKQILSELKAALTENCTVNKNKDELDARLPEMAKAYEKAYAALEALKTQFPQADITGDLQFLNEHAKTMWADKDLATQGLGDGSGHAEALDDYQSAFDGWVDQINNEIDDLSKNAELNMIQLQSMVSQRQTAIQLTQGIMDKLLKTLEQLASKVGG